jgi:trk system potassium uptake protein TrkH
VTRDWINQWEIIRREPTSLWRRLSAPQLFAGSFLLLVLMGTVGFKVLPGLYTGEPLSWLNALFTATSAVCVTGLIVVDTATYFTVRGQAFVLLLIQLGGLGMITFSTLIIVVLRRRLSLRHEQLTSVAEVAPHVNFQRLTRDVLVFTGLFELAGALLLYLLWIPRFGWQGAGWPALFHSISAFCNAGFSIFSDSLIGFQRAPITLLIVMLLIVAGGLGFLTLEDLYLRQRATKEKRRFRISLHSRLVLTATATLLIGGWILYTIFEWRLTLSEIPIWARPVNSLFMSVTARTAGFNNINYEDASASTTFLTILLMAVGGAPGSTAGGLKVTTIALLVLLAWSRFRGREIASLWGRSVPEETMQRAVGLFVVGFVVLTAAIFAFISLEMSGPHASGLRSFLHYMFEATSAFNTVGLSMGVTAELESPARWLTIVLMYVGRIGPLTFAAAIALSRYNPRGEFRFAYEDVVVG